MVPVSDYERLVGNSEVTVHFLGLRKIADELIYGTPYVN
jgi:hypothetical protein